MPFDVARARSETAAAEGIVHLNSAGASLSPDVVVDTVVDHLRLEARIGGYEAADAAADRQAATYSSIAGLIGGDRSEIALVESATRAWDVALSCFRFEPGQRIVTSRSEYASNVLALLHLARHQGVEVVVAPDDDHGQIDVDALASLLDDRVRLVAVNHVPTQSGLVQPVERIGRVTQAAGVPFLLDACQSVGQLEVDVQRIRCDLLSATGRKFLRGPRGTGFLFVRRALLETLEPAVVDLQSARWTGAADYEVAPDATRFETWESSIAARLGLGAAVDYARTLGMRSIEERCVALGAALRERLSDLDGVVVLDPGQKRCAIVTFSVSGWTADDFVASLHAAAPKPVNVHVVRRRHARFDFEARGLDSAVRASPHYFNDDADLDALVAALKERL